MGGEDFSEYLKFVPGCFVYVGTGVKKVYPWHHEKFDIDEKALFKGARFLSETAIRFLNKH
jgi:amidohydrolase